MRSEILSNLLLPDENFSDASIYPYLNVNESDTLSSVFPVSMLAVSSMHAAACSLQRYAHARGVDPGGLSINPMLAGLWFANSARPVGWDAPPLWDPVAGDYACADGWIRLHTNYSHHRQAALSILGCKEDRVAVEKAVAQWSVDELEKSIVGEGGCAAAMRSMADWATHEQGLSVADEPLIHWTTHASDAANNSTAERLAHSRSRPLQGIRVLDCTRVLAGPAATRFLAGFGADVLRIDPPHWQEGVINLDMTLGKRRAGLDLTNKGDLATFKQLLQQADVFVHGFRADALENLGLGENVRKSINPGLIDVALNAYGWHGPWICRRGFDSLVQMSCGIADYGMQVVAAEIPTPLPVQALDHATGYLMAGCVLTGLYQRQVENVVCSARLSLARTARLLTEHPLNHFTGNLNLNAFNDAELNLEKTVWGDLQRLPFPVAFENCQTHWHHTAGELRTHDAAW